MLTTLRTIRNAPHLTQDQKHRLIEDDFDVEAGPASLLQPAPCKWCKADIDARETDRKPMPDSDDIYEGQQVCGS